MFFTKSNLERQGDALFAEYVRHEKAQAELEINMTQLAKTFVALRDYLGVSIEEKDGKVIITKNADRKTTRKAK